MIELRNDQLVFRFPDVHREAECRIEFQRTLRIPDDNREYHLPPGFGRFPLIRVDDYSDRVPETWNEHGGIFLPMHQAEAMWLYFSSEYPMAVKVAAGKIDALTGDEWAESLTDEPQDYLTLPDQPWLDGFSVGKGQVRQFVAMPLGAGYTAEEQLTGKADHGGLQVAVYPMKAGVYEKWAAKRAAWHWQHVNGGLKTMVYRKMSSDSEMGLAPGGLMRQEIFDDRHGLDAWDTSVRSRCFAHILNSAQFMSVTGAAPPSAPPTSKEYTDAGLPWFEYYGGDLKAIEGAKKLAGLDSVAVRRLKKGKGILPDNEPVKPRTIVKVTKRRRVREGRF